MSDLQEGFGERTVSNSWNVKNGVLAKRCSENTAGAVAVTKKDGSIVYEIQKPYFVGRLKKVEVRTHEEYGDFLAIHMEGGGEAVKIEMNFDSGYAFGFLSTIPSAKIAGLIKISPSYIEKDGKKQSKIFIEDENGWCKQFFTKDNPNGLPQMEQIRVKGKDVWDSTKRLEFFKDQLIPKLNAGLEKIWGNDFATQAATTTTAAPKAEAVVEKLPF